MSKSDLKHYVRVYPHYKKEICDKTVEHLKNPDIHFDSHTFYNPQTGEYKPKSGDKELETTWQDVPTKNNLRDELWFAIDKYVKDLNLPYFYGWQGYSDLRFNRYDKNKQMAQHVDHIHTLFEGDRRGIPVLSIVGMLNDDYDGGEFMLFDDWHVPLKTGDVIIFPSVFLYPHRVEPITRGTRYTFISWVF